MSESENADPNAPFPDSLYDLTILGGGPVGLFAAYYAGFRGMKTKIVDSLDVLGGQLTALYPEKFIFDVPGFPQILARDLAKNLVEQAIRYEPGICLNETVQHLTSEMHPTLGTTFTLSSDKRTHHSRALLIAAGAGAFSPRKLHLPEALALENHGVYYAVHEKALFAGKKVLVIGGGDSAIDWSLNLLDTAGTITLIHRRNVFRAHEASVRELQRSRAVIKTFYELQGLIAADGALTGAVIEHTETGETETLPVDAVLVQIGFLTSLGPMKNWPFQFEKGAIRVDAHMETCIPNIFAAGDIAAYDGKLKLIATGFGEAAMAVSRAKTRIDPHAKFFPGHSSELVAHPSGQVTL